MANSKQFQIQVNATMSGDLQGQIKSVQSQMNALKNAAKFSKQFGNLTAAMKYASKMAPAFSQDSKLAGKLSEYQKLQSQIQGYKEAMRAVPKLEANLQKQLQQNTKAAADKRLAAEKVASLKIQLQQLEAARAGLKRTSSEYKNLQAQVKQTKAEIKSANDALKTANSVFKSTQGSTLSAGANLSRQISQLREMRGALSAAGVGLNQLGAAEMHLRSQIDSTTAALQRQHEIANRRMELRANFDNASSNLSEKYQNFQNAVQTAQTIMDPFTTAAQNAMTYEYELANVKALTQLKDIRAGNLEKVNTEMKMLDETFRRLGASTEYTSTEIAQSAGYFAMAGWDSNKIQSVMPAFINLATATRTSGAELARLADTFSDDMTAAGLKAGQMITYGKDKNGNALQMEASEYYSNAMAYAVTNANLNRESLHEGVKYFAPVAKNLGLDVAEMFATTMLTANAGIKGSQMGTAFRSGLIRLVAPTKGAAGALAEMGMTMSDAQRGFHEAGAELEAIGISANATFSEKLKGISDYLSTVDQNKKTDFINKVFGKNAFSAWAEVFSDPSKVAQIAEYTKAMRSEEMVGYAGDTAGVMRKSSHVQWEMLKSAWDANINQFGTALLPSIIQISQNLSPILLSLSEWIAKNQELVVVLAEVAAAVSAIIVAAAGIQLFGAAFGMVKASALLAKEAIAAIAARLAAVSFASIGSAISSIGTAFMAAARGAMAFVLTPVGAVVTAVAAAAYLIYDNWEKVGPVFESAAEALKGAFGKAVEYVGELWDGLVEKFNKLKEFFHFDFGSDNPAKNAFDFSKNIPTYQSASLGNLTAPVQQVQPVQSQIENVQPTLDLSKIQADIDFLGDSLQNQSYNFESFNLAMQGKSEIVSTSLAEIVNSAESTAAQVEGVNATISENAVNVANLNPLILENTTGTVGNTAEILNNSTALQESIAAIQNFAATAESSTASISNLASSANSAAMSLGGLGGAVSSAIASIQIAGANAAAAIPTSKVANNYSGGIYHGGAFLSWINEKGPEAIIPLDGSSRAVNLWQTTGKLLGVENNFAGNIFNSSGGTLKIPTGTSWNPNLPNPLPQIEIPQIDIFSQIEDKIANVKDIFGKIKDIFGNFNFESIFGKIKDIFSNFNFENIFGGGALSLEEIVGMTLLPQFPEIETPNTSMSQQSFQPNFTFNITVNSKNAEEFQEQIPEIEKSFEEQFESYVTEWQRRNFAW